MEKEPNSRTYAHKRAKFEDRLAYTVLEGASLIGVSYTTLWRAIGRGELHTIKGLGVKRISKKELERFVATHAEVGQ
jgi:hypothetical protein